MTNAPCAALVFAACALALSAAHHGAAQTHEGGAMTAPDTASGIGTQGAAVLLERPGDGPHDDDDGDGGGGLYTLLDGAAAGLPAAHLHSGLPVAHAAGVLSDRRDLPDDSLLPVRLAPLNLGRELPPHLRVVDVHGSPLDAVFAGQQVQIIYPLDNRLYKPQEFVYILQISSPDGFVTSIGGGSRALWRQARSLTRQCRGRRLGQACIRPLHLCGSHLTIQLHCRILLPQLFG